MKTMKNTFKKAAFLLFTTLFIASCSGDDSDDSNNNNNNTSADQTIAIAQEGTWRVTYFFDTDSEETNDFNGYTFNFNSDGTLVASNGTNTVNGTWSVDDSSSSSDDDDNSSDDDDFNIFFAVDESSDFEDLNDDWDIISVTSTKIELTDVSGGNGGTDFLTFEKI